MSDSLLLASRKASSLDTSLTAEEVDYSFNLLRSQKLDLLRNYDLKLKALVFEDDFGLVKNYKKEAKRLIRKIPLGFASQYLNNLSLNYFKKTEDTQRSSQILEVFLSVIRKTGDGSWEKPYMTLSFYDAYFIVCYMSGALPEKGDYFIDDDNRLLSAFQFFRESDDSIQIIYFDLGHLRGYYEEEIKKRDELIFN